MSLSASPLASSLHPRTPSPSYTCPSPVQACPPPSSLSMAQHHEARNSPNHQSALHKQMLPRGPNLADHANIQGLREKFKAIDRNGDGLVSESELITLLIQLGMDTHTATKHSRHFLSLFTSLPASSNTMSVTPSPSSSNISLSQTSPVPLITPSSASASSLAPPSDSASVTTGISYAAFVKEYIRMTRFKVLKKLQKKFQRLDLNGDGMLSKDEFLIGLQQQIGNDTMTTADYDSLFRQIDENNDNQISFKEFWNWYRLKSTWIMQHQSS